MTHRIIVDRTIPLKIAKLMDVCPATVSLALNYKVDSPIARRIRHMAVKDFGGIEIGK